MLVNVRIGFNPSATVKASNTPKVPYNLGNWTYMNKPVFPAKINSCLQTVVYGNETVITANVTDQDSLKSVIFNYTDDDWQTFRSIQMDHIVNQT